MLSKSTMPEMWRGLMESPSVDNVDGECCVCRALGLRTPASDRHHMVPRSAGRLFDCRGRELAKPTIRLCGMGNASGHHGAAHSGLLHFRWVVDEPSPQATCQATGGHLEFLLLDEPADRLAALSTRKGWRRI